MIGDRVDCDLPHRSLRIRGRGEGMSMVYGAGGRYVRPARDRGSEPRGGSRWAGVGCLDG
jgi:hypothetical protein